MPELPDVEIMRRYARKALDQKIDQASIKKRRILQVSGSTLRRHLLGNRFTGTGRHGKYLFLGISDSFELVLHFGMTGDLHYYKGKEPEYSALDIRFSNGYSLSVISIRKFGEIDITQSRKNFIKEKGLGPDALKIKKDRFMQILKNSRGSIKNILMDQKKIAGIGNIYADEILFQMGIHPGSQSDQIKEELYPQIYKTIQKVLRMGINGKIPSNYLIPRRIDLSYSREGADRCPRCGGKIKNITVGGRSTYYCSRHQHKKS